VSRLRLDARLAARLAGRAAGARLPGVAAALATGLALALAFPGPDLGPLAFCALVPLLLAVTAGQGAGPGGARRAGALGYLAGVAFFAAHLWWIAIFGILAWVALTLVEALAFAAFFALVPAATRRLGPWRFAVLPAAWAALEWLRAHGPLGGFPWGLLGLSQHGGGPLLPLARVVGVYGLGAVIVAVNLALAETVRAAAGRRRLPALGWPALAAALALSGLLAPAPPPPDRDARQLRLALVQASVPPGDRRENRAATIQAVFDRHLRMTRALAGAPAPDLIVWGEGAIDDDPFAARNADRLAAIRAALRAVGAPLLAGATTDRGPDHFATEALLFDADGRLTDRYAKRRLVPFGEYVPGGDLMRALVPPTRQVPYDKLPGTRLAPMRLDGVRIGTVICYESAYPEDARRLARDAQVLLVLTTNASYGYSPASRQHLASSQLRAVEEGRTVVHAAESGITAVVGPDGVARQRTGLYQQTTVQALVAPRSGLTLYARFGHQLELGLLAVAFVGLAATVAPRRRPAGSAGRPRPAGAASPPAPLTVRRGAP
jgi:apolipoprotein N-acyltransferase